MVALPPSAVCNVHDSFSDLRGCRRLANQTALTLVFPRRSNRSAYSETTMEESSLIYCDESGNDGPNYLNEESPFYVLAGWVVPEKAVVDAAIEMESSRNSHCSDAPELKFKMFRRKPWAVSKSICRLGQFGLVPILSGCRKAILRRRSNRGNVPRLPCYKTRPFAHPSLATLSPSRNWPIRFISG
jgi:hypothetical protein